MKILKKLLSTEASIIATPNLAERDVSRQSIAADSCSNRSKCCGEIPPQEPRTVSSARAPILVIDSAGAHYVHESRNAGLFTRRWFWHCNPLSYVRTYQPIKMPIITYWEDSCSTWEASEHSQQGSSEEGRLIKSCSLSDESDSLFEGNGSTLLQHP